MRPWNSYKAIVSWSGEGGLALYFAYGVVFCSIYDEITEEDLIKFEEAFRKKHSLSLDTVSPRTQKLEVKREARTSCGVQVMALSKRAFRDVIRNPIVTPIMEDCLPVKGKTNNEKE